MLFRIEDVGTTKTWDYSQPTLMCPGRFTQRPPTTNASFRDLFYGKFPALKAMKWENIAIRGGAIIDLLLQRTPKDLDIFFYDLEPEQVLTRAQELVDFFLTAEKTYTAAENERQAEQAKKHGHSRSSYQQINIRGVRIGSVVTVRLSAIPAVIQIVLAHHESIESLASSTDFAVCGVIFDGNDVLVSEAARFELENMSIVIKSDNYPCQKRIQKYYGKGFDFIFPKLDIKKLPRHYLKLSMCDAIQTEGVAFAYSAIDGNKITLDKFISMNNDVPVTDYDGARSTELDARAVIYKNIEMLCKGEKKFLVFAEADFVGRVLDIWPKLGPRQVENTFAGIKNSIYQNESFDFTMYEKYVTQTSMKDVLMKMCDLLIEKKSLEEKMEPLRDAIDCQVAYCNRAIVELNKEFEGAKIPIQDVYATFPKDNDASKFYGDYLLVDN